MSRQGNRHEPAVEWRQRMRRLDASATCDIKGATPIALQPELYRIREAAAVLAVSPRTIYAYLEMGELTPVRLPGAGQKRSPVRIARADVLAFVARLRGVSA